MRRPGRRPSRLREASSSKSTISESSNLEIWPASMLTRLALDPRSRNHLVAAGRAATNILGVDEQSGRRGRRWRKSGLANVRWSHSSWSFGRSVESSGLVENSCGIPGYAAAPSGSVAVDPDEGEQRVSQRRPDGEPRLALAELRGASGATRRRARARTAVLPAARRARSARARRSRACRRARVEWRSPLAVGACDPPRWPPRAGLCW